MQTESESICVWNRRRSIYGRGRIGALPDRSTRNVPFWNAALPSVCTVPLHQHYGSGVDTLVEAGDRVREGMVIGRTHDRFSTLVHAPIPGIVSRVGRMQCPDGTASPAVEIELSGEFDQLGKPEQRHEWDTLGTEELLELVFEAGVVGLGRSALPLHLELRRYSQSDNPKLIVDLAESEPYGFALGAFLRRFGEQVMEGAAIVARIIGAASISVIASRSLGRSLTSIRRPARQFGVSFSLISTNYPANLDVNLRRRVGEQRGGAPSENNAMILDANTALAVFEAVVRYKPQIDRIVTVNGDIIKKPAILRVRLGTPLSVLLEECGGLDELPERLVVGHGALTGHTVENVHQPVTKTVGTVTALSRRAARKRRQETCIGCGFCARACPVGLDPTLLYNMLERGRLEEAGRRGLWQCVECGACSYVCPSRIPLAHAFRDTHRSGKVRRPEGSTP